MRPYKLYKVPNTTDCEQLLWVTRYLYSLGINVRPRNIQQRLFPANVINLPAIMINPHGVIICGLEQIVSYYEDELQLSNLLKLSKEFRQNNPNYRITGA